MMRCIGMGKWKFFGPILGESLLLSILGATAGALCGLIAEDSLSTRVLSTAAALISVFLLGAAAAALRITGINVMKLMKAED